MAEESAVWFKMCFYSAEGLINKDSALGPKVWKKGATKNATDADLTGLVLDLISENWEHWPEPCVGVIPAIESCGDAFG